LICTASEHDSCQCQRHCSMDTYTFKVGDFASMVNASQLISFVMTGTLQAPVPVNLQVRSRLKKILNLWQQCHLKQANWHAIQQQVFCIDCEGLQKLHAGLMPLNQQLLFLPCVHTDKSNLKDVFTTRIGLFFHSGLPAMPFFPFRAMCTPTPPWLVVTESGNLRKSTF